MADGVKLGSGYNDYFPVAGVSDDARAPTSWSPGPYGLIDQLTPLSLSVGTIDENLPTNPSGKQTGPAVRLTSFYDDFYARIFVNPLFIDFGAISSQSTVVVRVWNAYYDRSVTLQSVTYDANVGLAFNGLVPPTTLLPLQEIAYEVTALESGPAAFNTTITWQFDTPWSYNQPVSGTRSRLWLFDPAWPPSGKNYVITYEYKTEIITSRSGREQRIALRSTPRRAVNYRVLLQRAALKQYNDTMRQWQARTFVIPELPRFTRTAAVMMAGSPSFEVTEVPRWLVPGIAVVLRGVDTVVGDVESVVGNVVTLKGASSFDWPAGTKVHYGMTGYMETELSAPRETNHVAQLDLKLNVKPVGEKYLAPAAATVFLDGREVFLKRPNWARPVEATIGIDVAELDYGRGPVARFRPIDFPTEARKMTFLGRTYAEMEEIQEFFHRMKGRQGEFYMPTWEPEFEPKVAAQPLTNSLRIFGTEFATIYKDSTVYRAIWVKMKDGALLLRKVDRIEIVIDGDGTDSFIHLTENWDREISAATVAMCGWMPAWRLASDILTVEWVTDSVAQVQLAMQTIEDLPVETP